MIARIGRDDVAFALDTLREITQPPETTRIPNTPAGVAMWRGSLVPVVELWRLVGAAASHTSHESRALILDTQEPLCVVVDAVHGLRQSNTNPVDDPPTGIVASLARVWTAMDSDTAPLPVLDATLIQRLLVREMDGHADAARTNAP